MIQDAILNEVQRSKVEEKIEIKGEMSKQQSDVQVMPIQSTS